MNKEKFVEEIKKLNITINDEIMEKLNRYYVLLKDYNEHTNLTRIIEEEEVYLKHFYDSLTITKIVDLSTKKNLLDIGSGAGFPGIILKIFYPNLEVTCLDSNNKKTKFLSYVSNGIGVSITVVHDRAENFVKKNLNKFDVVTARAVANLRVLTELCTPFVKKNGNFIAMKGNIEEELNEAKLTIKILNLSIINNIKFELPENAGERSIINFEKKENSDLISIRNYDKILKQPLK